MNKTIEVQENRNWVTPVLIALIGGFMSILNSSIINVAIPTMMSVFNATTTQIEWIVTVYLLTLGIVIPFSGWAGDKYGYKRLYILAMILFTSGSLLCTVGWSVPSLIAARIIQALGGGLLMPTMMTMVKKIVPEKNFGTAMGIVGVALLIAPALGPTVGGYLVEYVGWRWIFTINVPIGIIGILLSIFFLPEFERIKTEKLDWGGAITAIVMLFSLLLALSKGSNWGWSSRPIVLMLLLSLVSFGLFLYIELTSKNPLLNLRTFKSRNFTMANLATTVTTIGLFSGVFYVPLFLQNYKNLGALETGLLMLPGALVSGLLMPVVGRLYDRIGPKPLEIFGIISLTVTTFLFHNLNDSTTTTTVAFWMVLRGVAMAFAAVPAQTASLESVTRREVGGASALVNIVSRVSGALGLAALTAVLTNRTAFHATQISSQMATSSLVSPAALPQLIQATAFVKGLDDVFMVVSILTILGLIPALFLKKKPQLGVNSPA